MNDSGFQRARSKRQTAKELSVRRWSCCWMTLNGTRRPTILRARVLCLLLSPCPATDVICSNRWAHQINARLSVVSRLLRYLVIWRLDSAIVNHMRIHVQNEGEGANSLSDCHVADEWQERLQTFVLYNTLAFTVTDSWIMASVGLHVPPNNGVETSLNVWRLMCAYHVVYIEQAAYIM